LRAAEEKARVDGNSLLDNLRESGMRVVSLFSGIGGFEVGFAKAGFNTVLMCESDPVARAVLEKRFPDIEIRKDVRKMRSLPSCDILAAGWPCQDLSQAGRTAGISGLRSSLVGEVFRLLRAAPRKPDLVVLENVAFALHLQKGRALSLVTDQLEDLGYRWAYRILDTKHFGLPQRRRRLFVVASLSSDPSSILFDGFAADTNAWPNSQSKFGFYWTEGNTGIGWSPGAIPPLKGGSGLSIPSPPAIWKKDTGDFIIPGVRDAEQMQGFSSSWTRTEDNSPRAERLRWRLIGNAVSVPVAEWIGQRIKEGEVALDVKSIKSTKRANAGLGGPKQRSRTFLISESPSSPCHVTLDKFELRFSAPLSQRAASGFLKRVTKSSLRVDSRFVRDLRAYTR
jgi:DNA (cytosine-5)-methyltransferase 1